MLCYFRLTPFRESELEGVCVYLNDACGSLQEACKKTTENYPFWLRKKCTEAVLQAQIQKLRTLVWEISLP